jgi:hypothetical protein
MDHGHQQALHLRYVAGFSPPVAVDTLRPRPVSQLSAQSVTVAVFFFLCFWERDRVRYNISGRACGACGTYLLGGNPTAVRPCPPAPAFSTGRGGPLDWLSSRRDASCRRRPRLPFCLVDLTCALAPATDGRTDVAFRVPSTGPTATWVKGQCEKTPCRPSREWRWPGVHISIFFSFLLDFWRGERERGACRSCRSIEIQTFVNGVFILSLIHMFMVFARTAALVALCMHAWTSRHGSTRL